MSYYPAGCTERHIDEQFGDDCWYDDCPANDGDDYNEEACTCIERDEEAAAEQQIANYEYDRDYGHY
jgi:hypothetical protein